MGTRKSNPFSYSSQLKANSNVRKKFVPNT